MKARLILLLVAAASVVSALGSSPASAATWEPSGTPGTFEAQTTLGLNDMGMVKLRQGQVKAYRSPGYSGTQTITITWQVWHMVGGLWKVYGSRSTSYTVKPGYYVDFPGFTAQGLPNYYSTDVTVTWRRDTGTFLGSVFRDFIHQGDYQCGYSFGCDVGVAGGQWALYFH